MQLLQAKIDDLRANLLTAQSQLEQSAVVNHELGTVKAQVLSAGIDIQALPQVAVMPASSPRPSGTSPSADISTYPQISTPSSGQTSPGLSPFQSVALELPISSAIEQADGDAAAVDLPPVLETTHQVASAGDSTVVASLQKENTALKSQLEQLTQREAVEEADVASLQAQNKELIADLEKLRGQVGEVGAAQGLCCVANNTYSTCSHTSVYW